MILDTQNLFSDAQALTATAVSDNVIDTQILGGLNMNRDIGKGEPVRILVQPVSDLIGLTSLTVTIETSDDEAFGASKVLASSGAVLPADLTAGGMIPLNFMPFSNQRYIRLNYTVAGTASAGAVTAGFAWDVQSA